MHGCWLQYNSCSHQPPPPYPCEDCGKAGQCTAFRFFLKKAHREGLTGMAKYLRKGETTTGHRTCILVHCWRGSMCPHHFGCLPANGGWITFGPPLQFVIDKQDMHMSPLVYQLRLGSHRASERTPLAMGTSLALRWRIRKQRALCIAMSAAS